MQYDPRQLHRRPGTGVHRDRTDIWRRPPGDPENATDRPVAGDPATGQDFQFLPRQFVGRNDPDIRGARSQLVRAARRDPELQVEQALLGSIQHAPDQRGGVQVADGANSQLSSRILGQSPVYQGGAQHAPTVILSRGKMRMSYLGKVEMSY